MELFAARRFGGGRQAGGQVGRVLLQPLAQRAAEGQGCRLQPLQARAQLGFQPLEPAARHRRGGRVSGVPPAAQARQQVVEAGPLAAPQRRPHAFQPEYLHLGVAAPAGLPHQAAQRPADPFAGRLSQPRPIGAQHAAAPAQRYPKVVERLRPAGPAHLPDGPIGLRQVAAHQHRRRLRQRPFQKALHPRRFHGLGRILYRRADRFGRKPGPRAARIPSRDTGAAPTGVQSQVREPAVWYSVTRVSKKFFSLLRSMICAIHGNGFSRPYCPDSPMRSIRRSAMYST